MNGNGKTTRYIILDALIEPQVSNLHKSKIAVGRSLTVNNKMSVCLYKINIYYYSLVSYHVLLLYYSITTSQILGEYRALK